MRIGEIAHRAGVSTRALRYYEEQGLLSSERTHSGQRTYPESAVERVRLIQQFFTAGLPSRTILQLLPCVDTGHASAESFELLHPRSRARTDAVQQHERQRTILCRARLAIADHALRRGLSRQK